MITIPFPTSGVSELYQCFEHSVPLGMPNQEPSKRPCMPTRLKGINRACPHIGNLLLYPSFWLQGYAHYFETQLALSMLRALVFSESLNIGHFFPGKPLYKLVFIININFLLQEGVCMTDQIRHYIDSETVMHGTCHRLICSI